MTKDFKIEIEHIKEGVQYTASYALTGKVIVHKDAEHHASTIDGSILMVQLAMIDTLLADENCRKRIKERLA